MVAQVIGTGGLGVQNSVELRFSPGGQVNLKARRPWRTMEKAESRTSTGKDSLSLIGEAVPGRRRTEWTGSILHYAGKILPSRPGEQRFALW